MRNLKISTRLMHGRTGSVLVVDDDAFSCGMLCEMLRDLGVAEVRCAGNGHAALRTLAGLHGAPDLLICDLFMPDMDGIEFLAELGRQKYQGEVLLISGGDVEMLALAQVLALADGIQLLGSFCKPLRQDILRSLLAPKASQAGVTVDEINAAGNEQNANAPHR
jgi:CheY-like chemotaxis protein